jgi:hypothetical protein
MYNLKTSRPAQNQSTEERRPKFYYLRLLAQVANWLSIPSELNHYEIAIAGKGLYNHRFLVK